MRIVCVCYKLKSFEIRLYTDNGYPRKRLFVSVILMWAILCTGRHVFCTPRYIVQSVFVYSVETGFEKNGILYI